MNATRISRDDQARLYEQEKGEDAAALQRRAAAPKCSSCGAPILWAVTEAGKRMPLDYDEHEGGNVFLFRSPPGSGKPWTCKVGRQEDAPPQFASRHFSHFATCPNAAEHRR
jgi:hypothetical protein